MSGPTRCRPTQIGVAQANLPRCTCQLFFYMHQYDMCSLHPIHNQRPSFLVKKEKDHLRSFVVQLKKVGPLLVYASMSNSEASMDGLRNPGATTHNIMFDYIIILDL